MINIRKLLKLGIQFPAAQRPTHHTTCMQRLRTPPIRSTAKFIKFLLCLTERRRHRRSHHSRQYHHCSRGCYEHWCYCVRKATTHLQMVHPFSEPKSATISLFLYTLPEQQKQPLHTRLRQAFHCYVLKPHSYRSNFHVA